MAFEESGELTPEQLFSEFRKASISESLAGRFYGYRAIDKFKEVKDKASFLEVALNFLKDETDDTIRSWGAGVLQEMKGKEAEKAFKCLYSIFDLEKSADEKACYPYTRFFALKAMKILANYESEKGLLYNLLRKLRDDSDEELFIQAEASILLALDEKSKNTEKVEAVDKIKNMLKEQEEFSPRYCALRALREFALEDVLDEVAEVAELKNEFFLKHRRQAILALGSYRNSEKWLSIVRQVGLILRTHPDSYLRLAAVESLLNLGHVEAQDDLMEALFDENAEVRVQAANALKKLLKDSAVRTVVQYALEDAAVRTTVNFPMRKGMEREKTTRLIQALRDIDPSRTYSSEVLSKELDSEDKERVKAADYILVDLGGWEAIQRVGQRRKTLETLRENLKASETAVTEAFKSTMRQAHRNFAFAMGINTIIVAVGISLIILAMWQLVQTPEKLESWIIPGGTGVLGIIISLTFNNSRQNAREDLTTLVNVSVIFQGFMRRLKEIDATFEKSYMESQFKIDDMEATVRQIDEAVARTLSLAHMICSPTRKKSTENKVPALIKGKNSDDAENRN